MDRDHGFDAGDPHGCVLVRGDEVGFVGRRSCNGGIEHARHEGVDAEFRDPVHLVLHVEPRDVLADVAELAFRFERRVLRHGQFRCLSRELAVGERLFALLVTHEAEVCRTVGDRHLPFSGGRRHEHLAGRGACLPERLIHVADAGAAAGGLHSEQDVLVSVACRGRLHADVLPVAVELVCNDHGERRINALAHLGLIHRDSYNIVRPDLQPDIGTEASALLFHLPRGQEPEPRRCRDGGNRETGARNFQKLSSAEVGLHFLPPAEARRMALLIFG